MAQTFDIGLPGDLKDPQKLNYIIQKLYEALKFSSPIINGKLGQVEPPAQYLYDGMLAYADGTLWDPGSGKGFYRYNTTSATWNLVG